MKLPQVSCVFFWTHLGAVYDQNQMLYVANLEGIHLRIGPQQEFQQTALHEPRCYFQLYDNQYSCHMVRNANIASCKTIH